VVFVELRAIVSAINRFLQWWFKLPECTFLCFLFLQAEAIFSDVTVVDNVTVAQALMVVDQLANITEPTTFSIFPRDLNTSNYIITNTVDLLITDFNQGGTTDLTAVCLLLLQTYTITKVVCGLEVHNMDIPQLPDGSEESTT